MCINIPHKIIDKKEKKMKLYAAIASSEKIEETNKDSFEKMIFNKFAGFVSIENIDDNYLVTINKNMYMINIIEFDTNTMLKQNVILKLYDVSDIMEEYDEFRYTDLISERFFLEGKNYYANNLKLLSNGCQQKRRYKEQLKHLQFNEKILKNLKSIKNEYNVLFFEAETNDFTKKTYGIRSYVENLKTGTLVLIENEFYIFKKMKEENVYLFKKWSEENNSFDKETDFLINKTFKIIGQCFNLY